ncbi:C2H2 type zinc-finger-domain-containing protein [Thelephora terrestris]|uniref:C2H2 type zinc-finger-domain-containing protein n=1 Tax=Thelephora terrestris TaxID=56493 RepID=A0A9P6HQ11_9AGAM|nr:C2H2 type zinc-finger-domain-containing protein [Thelephora terrestris]
MSEEQTTDSSNLFTCLSCSIAFYSAEEQREHYRSDHHRYNMKRRVAGLPPVSVQIFNEKVLDRKAETAIMASTKGSVCDVCKKTYTTENAYRSHINSKKHRETELKLASRRDAEPIVPQSEQSTEEAKDALETPPAPIEHSPQLASEEEHPGETSEPQSIEERIASLRLRISPFQCLFCSTPTFKSIDENVSHMASAHSFFIPDLEYLTDLSGLLSFLGERIAVDNICISCPRKSREFRSLEAVRKHMVDKGHCKIAYDTESERLSVSDFYDFSSSYPTVPEGKKGTSSKKRVKVVVPDAELTEDNGWEDVDDGEEDGEFDEVVEESVTDSEGSGDEEDELSDEAGGPQITYGDTVYELVLPSGARIGHRSLQRYYKQSFANPLPGRAENPNSGVGLVRKLIGDRNSTLVPVKGGYGAFGSGTMTVKARNRGEAKEAGRHIREFRDQQRREQFKTKVGFIHNHQKHFRDPLLQ